MLNGVAKFAVSSTFIDIKWCLFNILLRNRLLSAIGDNVSLFCSGSFLNKFFIVHGVAWLSPTFSFIWLCCLYRFFIVNGVAAISLNSFFWCSLNRFFIVNGLAAVLFSGSIFSWCLLNRFFIAYGLMTWLTLISSLCCLNRFFMPYGVIFSPFFVFNLNVRFCPFGVNASMCLGCWLLNMLFIANGEIISLVLFNIEFLWWLCWSLINLNILFSFSFMLIGVLLIIISFLFTISIWFWFANSISIPLFWLSLTIEAKRIKSSSIKTTGSAAAWESSSISMAVDTTGVCCLSDFNILSRFGVSYKIFNACIGISTTQSAASLLLSISATCLNTSVSFLVLLITRLDDWWVWTGRGIRLEPNLFKLEVLHAFFKNPSERLALPANLDVIEFASFDVDCEFFANNWRLKRALANDGVFFIVWAITFGDCSWCWCRRRDLVEGVLAITFTVFEFLSWSLDRVSLLVFGVATASLTLVFDAEKYSKLIDFCFFFTRKKLTGDWIS